MNTPYENMGREELLDVIADLVSERDAALEQYEDLLSEVNGFVKEVLYNHNITGR